METDSIANSSYQHNFKSSEDITAFACKMLAKIRLDSSFTGAQIDRIADVADTFILEVLCFLKEKTEKFFFNHKINLDTAEKQNFLNVFEVKSYFTNLKNFKNQICNLKKFYKYVDPQNVPKHVNSFLGGIHLLATCYNADISKYGFEKILAPFINDLKDLESDDGEKIYFDDTIFTLRATLACVCADGLAAHQIFNLLSLSARHFCRLCLISRNELKIIDCKNFKKRTIYKRELFIKCSKLFCLIISVLICNK